MEFPKLDEEFKKKWTEALRSGEYEQGTGQLYNSFKDKFCCLGVAAVVAGEDTTTIDGHGVFSDFLVDRARTEGREIKMPKELQGNRRSNKTVGSLYYKNDGLEHGLFNPDGKKHSFSEIADWIEENL
jgi:hypothetical protein